MKNSREKLKSIFMFIIIQSIAVLAILLSKNIFVTVTLGVLGLLSLVSTIYFIIKSTNNMFAITFSIYGINYAIIFLIFSIYFLTNIVDNTGVIIVIYSLYFIILFLSLKLNTFFTKKMKNPTKFANMLIGIILITLLLYIVISMFSIGLTKENISIIISLAGIVLSFIFNYLGFSRIISVMRQKHSM